MKKKQLAKLKQQFRPSFDVSRQLLFDTMTKLAWEKYNLKIRVFVNRVKAEMQIELLEEDSKDPIISVPLDENFNTVVKRIQQQEKGLLEQFSNNLVEEVVKYWFPEQVNEQPTPTDKAQEKSASMTLNEFKEQMESFPKFEIIQTSDKVRVVEKTAKEDRLLATISMKEVNSFTIESALERKYKLKLDVIPVIEVFAQTAVTER